MRLTTTSSTLSFLDQRLALHEAMLRAHPFLELARNAMLPREILEEFAYLQYVDSILWVPMLSLMKERARSERLTRAIRDNIACETGMSGTSHIEMARMFIRSLGLDVVGAGQNPDVVATVSQWTTFGEAVVAGWLYAAEHLVPLLFGAMRPGFAAIPGADLRYLDEHIAVDSDDHSRWMREAIAEIIQDDPTHPDVLLGIDLGSREVLDVPDVLYSKTLWKQRG